MYRPVTEEMMKFESSEPNSPNMLEKAFSVINKTGKKLKKFAKSKYEGMTGRELAENVDPMQNYFNKVNRVSSRLNRISSKNKEARKFVEAEGFARLVKGLGKDVLDAPLRTGAAVTTMVATPIMVHKAIKDTDKERRKEEAARRLNGSYVK